MTKKQNGSYRNSSQQSELKKIFDYLREKVHIDYSTYKSATVNRRMHRRMMMHNITNDFRAYHTFLQEHPEEVEALQKDLLINITRFFREPNKFVALENIVFPTLIKNHIPHYPIRIWVPGCSTGEEVYSIAIAFQEYLKKENSDITVQIFATDINPHLIEIARQGWYPMTIVDNITKKRLHNFFKKSEDGFLINKNIRDMCVFAVHDVLQNPPFSQIDLISCQNLLIYVNQAYQKNILSFFYYALNPKGFLLLGSSESAGVEQKFFRIVDSRQKVYAKQLVNVPNHIESLPPARMLPKQSVRRKVNTHLSSFTLGIAVKDEKLQKLKETLNQSREYADLVIDEINTMSKSLQSANEELLVNNEELQSANEELETSQEELQSANEELLVLNQELQKREETLSRLAAIIETSNDAIYSKNSEGIIISWNKGAERLYGYNAKEALGKTYEFLIPAGKKNDFPHIMQLLKQGKRVEHYETQRMTKDGRIINVSLTVSPLKDASGKIIGASKIVRDITKRSQIDKSFSFLSEASKVLASSLDYQHTLKTVGNLATRYMADWCMIYLYRESDKPEIIIAAREAEMKKRIEKYVRDFPSQPGRKTMIAQVLETKKPLLVQNVTEANLAQMAISEKHKDALFRLKTRSAMTIPLMIRKKIIGAIMFQSTSSIHRFDSFDLQIAQELADRAALAIENARLYTDAQHALALREDFISIASHELKTPLTSLKIYTQILQNKAQKTHQENAISTYINKVNSQLNTLQKLINDLLDVSRLEHGKLEFQRIYFDLNELAKETVDNIQPTTKKHTIYIEGVIHKKVIGDRFRIYQVLVNLLTNAIKYSPQSDKIIVRLMEEKSTAIVQVQDFGIGIEKKEQQRIFTRFYRVNAPIEKTYPGLGMGLYISYEIIRRHGGTFQVSSAKGKGSLFSFTLPFRIKKS